MTELTKGPFQGLFFALKLESFQKIWYNSTKLTFMKEFIYRLVWAGLLAFAITRLAMWIDTKWLIHEKWFFPQMLFWLESHGVVLRKVLFWILTAIFTIGDSGKKIGNLLLWLIGIAGALLILGLVIEFCSWFFPWVNSLI